jgi:uncharacterized SAM-binding protein YcdF (DUF218 family)
MRSLLRKVVLSCVFMVLVWCAGLVWFLAQIPVLESTQAEKVDAIVVLTGGAGRLEKGMRLFAEGRGKTLFITGAGKVVKVGDIIKYAPDDVRLEVERKAEGITLGHDAQNTIGNAEETSRWLEGKGYKKLALVTSAYHMPRSMEEFRHTLPDMTLLAEPVVPERFSPLAMLLQSGGRKLAMSEYHKYLAARLRHWLLRISEES